METKSKTTVLKHLLVLLVLIVQPLWLQAQDPGVSKKMVSGNQMNSLYIIGSVLVFGVIAYFVYSIIDKNRQAREGNKPQTRRPVSHRHHHHHRVIKKSA